jgi:hypothetical protein
MSLCLQQGAWTQCSDDHWASHLLQPIKLAIPGNVQQPDQCDCRRSVPRINQPAQSVGFTSFFLLLRFVRRSAERPSFSFLFFFCRLLFGNFLTSLPGTLLADLTELTLLYAICRASLDCTDFVCRRFLGTNKLTEVSPVLFANLSRLQLLYVPAEFACFACYALWRAAFWRAIVV